MSEEDPIQLKPFPNKEHIMSDKGKKDKGKKEEKKKAKLNPKEKKKLKNEKKHGTLPSNV